MKNLYFNKYQDVMNFLKCIKLSKQDILNSKFYNFLLNDMGLELGKNLFLSNITSMCLKTHPNAVRIRNDKFLKFSSENGYKNNSYLVAGVKEDNDLKFFIFSSKSFYGYNFSTNSSNSFIHFDLQQFETFVNYPGIQYKKIKSKKLDDMDILKYSFITLSDKSFDKDSFITSLNHVENTTNFSYYDKFFGLVKNISDPQIPNVTKISLLEYYDHSCVSNHISEESCRMKIDWKRTKEALENTNLNLPLDFHHLVPRKYFKNNFNDFLDWKIVHDEINIYPLCQICHNSIHSNNQSLNSDIIDNIFSSLSIEKKEKFVKYLNNNTVFKNIDDLKDYYRNEMR
ncbi:hypothetical protein [Mycoplasmopsis columboralis]|uniref:Uncharacterized protein n=1 Tax=Mycoplasmopsis columboralis TaxID=171282 RepID=A0A449B6C0_9BACT|nr:hypothetical protein [Mycoplasmopsis columboralis]VEU76160.1 Uncharacterised protein [Mycoplasmopsis columboralis]